ncbi:MAG: hypothetical protein GY717_10115 [Rhodobacteraceae bacterium]|nr:hypothetical protein [Paracoccaceae bacterium]
MPSTRATAGSWLGREAWSRGGSILGADFTQTDSNAFVHAMIRLNLQRAKDV